MNHIDFWLILNIALGYTAGRLVWILLVWLAGKVR